MTRGRKKKQVNIVAAHRVGIILDELKKSSGVTQETFGKQIFASQQSVYKLKNGEIDVSLDYAKRISEAYPQYRWQWILGIDDFKSPLDEAKHQRMQAMWESRFGQETHEREQRLILFKTLADMRGWDTTLANELPSVSAPSGKEFDVTESHGLKFDNYATATRDGSTVTLDRVQFDKLITRMLGIFDVEIQNA